MGQERANADELVGDLTGAAVEKAKAQLTAPLILQGRCVSGLEGNSGKQQDQWSSHGLAVCMLHRVRVNELGSDVVVCVPCPGGFCLFAKEKTLVEATTGLLLQRRTSQADQERQIVEIWVRGGYLVRPGNEDGCLAIFGFDAAAYALIVSSSTGTRIFSQPSAVYHGLFVEVAARHPRCGRMSTRNSEKIKRSTVQVVLLHARELTLGRFWLNHAARTSCAFDAIYWRCLDGRLFRSGTKSR
ncbi:kinase-like domain [Cordyceps militaris]|uniref:Kinase-like domain n=1 Tax=Cordyceps militaris TaxID=73501 RepID=A0A2H4SUX3_CORMI|nr:kinase-like domain [Cordyceps militaris]